MAPAPQTGLPGNCTTDEPPQEAVSLDALPFAAALLDANGKVRAVNRAWNTTECEEHYTSLAVQCGIRDVLEGRTGSFSEKRNTVSGVPCSVTVTPHGSGALIIRQALEASQTQASQKMETVGRLAGGVAHDFANLLILIAGYSDILLSRITEQDAWWPELNEIRLAAARGARLTAQLLGFTRGRAIEPRVLDLNSVVTGVERMLRPIIGEYIELRTALALTLDRIVADPGQMEQVLMNLLLNARDAMPQGGSILIETSNYEVTDDLACAHEMEPGPGVLLSISDTGHGMDASVIEHIWKPLFTTKEGKGTGLGLSTVQQIIKESRGAVSVRSVPGQGSTFTICLPRAPQSAGDAETLSPPRPELAGSEIVLLAEDEESVRTLLSHVLRSRGYQVLEASNGEEALHIFEKRAPEIHLVLTDMVMPRMTGRELGEQILRIRPDAKVIFMSGYTDDVLRHTGAFGSGISFLQKPLFPEVLAAKVREALDTPSRPFNPR